MLKRLEFNHYIIILFALISVSMLAFMLFSMGYIILQFGTDFPHGTEYADGFDEEVFAAIVPGDQTSTFLDKLGTPFHISDFVSMKRVSYKEKGALLYFQDSGHIYFAVLRGGSPDNPWFLRINDKGVLDLWGPPDDIMEGVPIETRSYSRSPKRRNYKMRSLYIDKDLNIVVYKEDDLWTD